MGLSTKEVLLGAGTKSRLSEDEIKKIIKEKLGEDYKVLKIESIKKHTHVSLIDSECYLYDKNNIFNIKQGKVPRKFHKSNPNTIYNIKIWCKLNNVPLKLLSEKYSGANKNLKWQCTNCNNIFERTLSNIQNGQLSCLNCGDGVSYPNKYIRSFFSQLNEEYIPEYNPKWAVIKHNNPKLNGKKKYDIYLSNKNEIWEIHGLQHYNGGFQNMKSKTLQEEQENDKIKKELAEQNGFNYIIVDARYSDLGYIKNSLLNLLEIKRYNLSLVDWNKCHEYACSSLVKVVCDLWNDGIKNTKQIAGIIKMNQSTITKYLKQGSKLGWCNYNPDEQNKRKVIQLDLDGNYIKEFESGHEAMRQTGISNKHISSCCNGKLKTAGSYQWIFQDIYQV